MDALKKIGLGPLEIICIALILAMIVTSLIQCLIDTFSGADSVTMTNSSAALSPRMVFTLMPSN